MSDEDRIARVADGQDPDEVIHLGADEAGAGRAFYSRDVLVPAWTTYAGEARRMIAAVRAMGLLE